MDVFAGSFCFGLFEHFFDLLLGLCWICVTSVFDFLYHAEVVVFCVLLVENAVLLVALAGATDAVVAADAVVAVFAIGAVFAILAVVGIVAAVAVQAFVTECAFVHEAAVRAIF